MVVVMLVAPSVPLCVGRALLLDLGEDANFIFLIRKHQEIATG
jgi:hypothetical protein